MAETEQALLWGEIVEDAPYPMSQEEFERRYLGEKGFELVEGRVIRSVANTGLHMLVAKRLLRALDAYALQSGLFEAFGADNTYRLHIPRAKKSPTLECDASLVLASRLPSLNNLIAWDNILELAPDLAVEIASKGQSSAVMGRKAGYFLAAGTRLVWVVYARERRAEMLLPGESEPIRLGYADELSGLDAAPGLAVKLRELC